MALRAGWSRGSCLVVLLCGNGIACLEPIPETCEVGRSTEDYFHWAIGPHDEPSWFYDDVDSGGAAEAVPTLDEAGYSSELGEAWVITYTREDDPAVAFVWRWFVGWGERPVRLASLSGPEATTVFDPPLAVPVVCEHETEVTRTAAARYALSTASHPVTEDYELPALRFRTLPPAHPSAVLDGCMLLVFLAPFVFLDVNLMPGRWLLRDSNYDPDRGC